MNARILLVEDDPGVSLVVADLLRAAGHEVATAADGDGGLRLAGQKDFDLLVLDVMLPGLDGFAVCHAMRERGFDKAILMLSARTQVADRVQGLRRGADDYMIKPFDPDELLARVEALLRRVHKQELTPVLEFRFGAVEVDFQRMECFKNHQLVLLAAKEMELLRLLINRRGEVLSREQILKLVWSGQTFIGERTVDVHIAWLRQKLEDTPQKPRFIQTVRGEGYRFTC